MNCNAPWNNFQPITIWGPIPTQRGTPIATIDKELDNFYTYCGTLGTYYTDIYATLEWDQDVGVEFKGNSSSFVVT